MTSASRISTSRSRMNSTTYSMGYRWAPPARKSRRLSRSSPGHPSYTHGLASRKFGPTYGCHPRAGSGTPSSAIAQGQRRVEGLWPAAGRYPRGQDGHAPGGPAPGSHPVGPAYSERSLG
eukprot:5144782-Amphidinium_carterae.1